MTELMYIERPDLFELPAQITNYGRDSKGIYLVLNQSLFYPQGGGQPADKGTIIATNAVYNVFDVRKVDDEVRHYLMDAQAIVSGNNVMIKIDKERRVLNSKYHTAGHLIAAMTEKISSKLRAIKGHQFPGEAYVEFRGTVSNSEDFLVQLTSTVRDVIISNAPVKTGALLPAEIAKITEGLPYDLPEDKTLRVCHIEGFLPVPCGGTHVETLQDISSLKITKCKSKKGKTKICYEVL